MLWKVLGAIVGFLWAGPLFAGGIVPREFQGVWLSSDASSDKCVATDWKGMGRNDNDQLSYVGDHQIEYLEDGCEIEKIIKHKGQGGTEVSLSCGSEGESWKAREAWTVKKVGGRDLLITTDMKTARVVVYVRCP